MYLEVCNHYQMETTSQIRPNMSSTVNFLSFLVSFQSQILKVINLWIHIQFAI